MWCVMQDGWCSRLDFLEDHDQKYLLLGYFRPFELYSKMDPRWQWYVHYILSGLIHYLVRYKFWNAPYKNQSSIWQHLCHKALLQSFFQCKLCLIDISKTYCSKGWDINIRFLADLGKARGCSTNSLVIDSFIKSVSQPFPPTALRRAMPKRLEISLPVTK